jgi:hypothetical protein
MTMLDNAARTLAQVRSGVDDCDALDDDLKADLRGEVREVLRALRDPTNDVTSAGAEIIRNVRQGESDEAFQSDAANTWRFMIDAVIGG